MSRYQQDDWDSDASEIECAACGETFYYEINRCPNCGRAVYPVDEDEDLNHQMDSDHRNTDFLEDWAAQLAVPAAIFIGLVIAFAVSTAAFMAFRFLLGNSAFVWPGRGLLLAGAPLGAAVGGYAAAAIEKESPRSVGFWVGGLSIIAAVVLAGVDADRVGSWLGLETLPLWLLTVLAGASGAEYWRRQQRDHVVQQLFIHLPEEDDLFNDLMQKIGHDDELAERLIDFERQYMPNATRRTLIESALNRWERDNR